MHKNELNILFRGKFGRDAEVIESLPPSGSHRRYFRMTGGELTAIGVFNDYINENRAFLSFCKTFTSEGLPVPEIYAVHPSEEYYLLKDLGDVSLKQELEATGGPVDENQHIWDLYRNTLENLVQFQVHSHSKIDYRFCVPRQEFDAQSVLWDLNHFKYFFLKVSGINFDEQKLEDDFVALTARLMDSPRDFFMYRDFQSRNIMIYQGSPWFIDFQGGRKGALQYDPASLLFEAKTALPSRKREELLNHYLQSLEIVLPGIRDQFLLRYYDFVLIRILQALGTYGLRGWVENKSLFLLSIPWAMKNLEWLLVNNKIPVGLKELPKLFLKMVASEELNYTFDDKPENLKIRINSFSYRKRIPSDLSGNGGGFVFDCRGIHNPGRYPEWKSFTGKDPEIARFFEERSEMKSFLKDVYRILDRSINAYQDNKYKHLQVSFGCTGGRHRSVFAAENLAVYLKENHKVEVELVHRDLIS